jgi:hypothetical protein
LPWATYHSDAPKFSIDLQGKPTLAQGNGITQLAAGHCAVVYGPIPGGDDTTFLRRGNANPKKRAFAKDGTGFVVSGEQRCLDSFKLE